MNVRIHGATPSDRVARKKQEAATAFDLVEVLFAVFAPNLYAVFLYQQGNQVAAVATAIALDSADFIEKRA